MTLEEDIKIIMVAEDRASDEVQAAAKRINDEYRKMESVNRAVGRSTILQNRELFATARVMTSIGNIAGRLTDIYTKYNIMQIRIGDTAKRVADAQEDLRKAILENGPGSQEAIDAARRLTEAQEDAKRAADEAKFAMVGFGLETLTAAGSIIQAIPRIAQLAAALRGVAGASAAATIGGALPTLAAGSGATGLLAGKAGLLARGAGIAGGAALVAGGALTSQAVTGTTDNFQRAMSVAQMAGGGALTGFMLGGPIGAAIGAGAGLVGGLATNYSQEFGNLFAGRGFLSDADAGRSGDINITVNGSDPNATASEVVRQLRLAQVAN